MKGKIVAIAVVLLTAGVWAPMALALDPMGPPTAGLRQGGWSVGLDYMTNQMNGVVKYEESYMDGEDDGGTRTYKFKDARMEKTFVNIGYGVADNWEAYVRLGGSKLCCDDFDVDGGYRTAWGLGSKVTVYQDGNLKLGGLFQISWNASKDIYDNGYYFDKAHWYEYQIAAGPTYKLTDKVSIYGGPFYTFLRGTFGDEEGADGTMKSNRVGGYIGGQFAVNDNLSLNAEYQLTTDAGGLGLMLVWKF